MKHARITDEAYDAINEYCKSRGMYKYPLYSIAIIIGIQELTKREKLYEQKKQGA